jgi:hypothetical protein
LINKTIKYLLIGIFLLVFPVKVFAVCPVCTIAVGAGLGLSRYLGIDDTVSGIWVGGLILSGALWFDNWLAKKNWKLKHRTLISVSGFYLLTLIPLYFTGIIGHVLNRIWGIDKLILGVIIGSLGFAGAVGMDKYLRRFTKDGKAVFNFQKVIIPLSILLVLSIIMYVVSK